MPCTDGERDLGRRAFGLGRLGTTFDDGWLDDFDPSLHLNLGWQLDKEMRGPCIFNGEGEAQRGDPYGVPVDGDFGAPGARADLDFDNMHIAVLPFGPGEGGAAPHGLFSIPRFAAGSGTGCNRPAPVSKIVPLRQLPQLLANGHFEGPEIQRNPGPFSAFSCPQNGDFPTRLGGYCCVFR
ncbi:MAG TPA: hypothetical protein VF840_08885 [Terriglobales bacterium]